MSVEKTLITFHRTDDAGPFRNLIDLGFLSVFQKIDIFLGDGGINIAIGIFPDMSGGGIGPFFIAVEESGVLAGGRVERNDLRTGGKK